MKNFVVKEVRMHVGVQFGGQVLTGITSAKHKAQMELHENFVYVVLNGFHALIPFANCHYIAVEPPKQQEEKSAKAAKESK